MAELKRAQSSRRGYRAHLKKLLQSVNELMATTQPLTEDNTAALRDLHEQLQRKKDVISSLDAKILNAIEDEEEIEAEVLQAEEIASSISTAKAKITRRLSSITPTDETATRTRASTRAPSSPSVVEHHVEHERVTRLPQLDLPQFTGNPLYWQTFWDCFEAAVHSNSSLTGVQKLSYLRAQLQGDAARVIAGFQLTNANYEHSIALLKERFGQRYKQIDAHMQALIDLPTPSNTLPSLREFYDSTEGHIRSLASLGKSENSYGSLLVPIILGKLPAKIKQNLARVNGKTEWTVTALQAALINELDIFEMGSQTESYTDPPKPTAAFHTGVKKPPAGAKGKPQCLFCKGSHSPSLCNAVKDPKQRTDIVRQERLCFNCLGHHKVSSCNSKHRCHNCRRKHHTSLCTQGQQQSDTPPENPVPPNNPAPSNTAAMSVNLQSSPVPQNNVCLLKTAVATVTHRNRSAKANILFDEGSQRSFVTRALAKALALQPHRREDINLSSFGAKSQLNNQMDVAMVNLLTSSAETVPLSVLVVPHIATPLQNATSISVARLPHLCGLQLAHPLTSERQFEISLLVGADHYWDIVGDRIVRGIGPTAVESKLGYLLSGPVQSTATPPTTANILMISTSSQGEFDLERFWSLESIGVSPTDNTENNMLENYLSSCITRNNDGAYIARFPWKPDHPTLPTNFVVTEHRTRQLVKRLAKTPDLLQMYNQIIAEQEARGFIERVEFHSDHLGVHYIPHHAVEKDSPTTPIRIVFDCSCRQSSTHPCLNDCLMVGLPCVTDLCAVLIRFRSHRYGISTDIEKAFLHIHLHPDDRDYTRFLWLTDPKDPTSQFCVYRFKVVPFGATSSPFMLNAVLKYHLRQHNSFVSHDMQSNLYVDNIISGCETEQAAVNYYKEARAIMSSARFNLRSWSSNSVELKATATRDNTADDNTSVNLLGLRWNPTTDELSLAPKHSILAQDHLVTKREVLQDLSKIFDPLGFVAPVVIRAKILMQKLWKHKIAWDDPLDETLNAEWKDIATNLKEATAFSIRRCYLHAPIPQPVIHCFADASQKAYGAVVFLTHQDQVSFIAAKTRVAPLKQLTLPRLELMAALVATRLTYFVLNAIPLQDPSIYIWSDSQIVLHWVKSQKQLPVFIRHRITEIRSQLPTANWRYCPTLENPADLLTRGTTTQALMSSSLWQQGPAWLIKPDLWPSLQQPPPPPLLVAAAVATEFVPTDHTPPNVGLHCIISLDRYNTLGKLLSVTVYVFRFTENLRVQSEYRRDGPISAEEFDKARFQWVRDIQQAVYWREINNLQLIMRQPRTPRALLVRQLRLFLDTEGFLRCGGRIHNAPLSEVTRFPYLLPSRHPLSRLIILDIHVTLCHSGTGATLTALRQSYWIPAARQYIKSILRYCVICHRVAGKPYSAPDPAPLPHLRTQDVHPFTFTGVDFTGALYVRHGGEEVKVYLCLFTCATTRAIHLEVVQDLTAETFILAFHKFAGRSHCRE